MGKTTYPYYVSVKISSGQLLKLDKYKKYNDYISCYDDLLKYFKRYPKSFNNYQYGILEYTEQYECIIITLFTKGIETNLL